MLHLSFFVLSRILIFCINFLLFSGNHNNNNASVSASISTLPSALVSSTAVAEAADTSDEEASFNYNSESSEEDYKFPTAVALTLPDAPVPDPLIAIETPLKRVAKDFIGSGV